MRVYVFTSRGAARRSGNIEHRTLSVLETIADGTDTRDLIVAVYLLKRKDFWQAHTYTRPVTRAVFQRTGKRWDFVLRFEPPPALPDRFPLVRMALGTRDAYPRTSTDVYGWRLRCERFEDLLAYAFAHELHHFRKYHLGLHPRQGEQAACRWALGRAAKTGFSVTGVRIRSERRPRRRSPQPLPPHYESLRALPPGTELTIVRDSGRRRYVGQRAIKVRNLRRNSYRMAVRTPDGREWRWPMQWLGLGKL